MNRLGRRGAAVATAALLGFGVAAAPAGAAVFLDHVQINAGSIAQGPGWSYGSPFAITVQSYGVAYSGAYVTNSGGVRVSEVDYCSSPGCKAQIAWPGARPTGYPTGRNHGNASTSFFAGVVDY